MSSEPGSGETFPDSEESLPQWSAIPNAGPVDADELLDQMLAPGASSRVAYRLQQLTPRRRGRRLNVLVAGVAAVTLLALGAAGYATLGPDSVGLDPVQSSEVESIAADGPVEELRLLLQGIGYDGIEVEERDGTLFVSGMVGSQADVAAVVTASASLAGGLPLNTDGLTVAIPEPAGPELAAPEPSTVQVDPLQQLQVVLNRTVAATPIIFELGSSSIASWHTGTLDQVAEILLANPGIAVTVVGNTDETGPSDHNQALSEERANAVREYLIDKGLEPGLIQAEARGETDATGVRDVGYLERRVEFEVVAASTMPLEARPLAVGVIVPSASNDLAFSQSLVGALAVLERERGGLTLTVSENMFDVDKAREQAEQYAQTGADVVILHGSQYQPLVDPLAEAWPEVVFVVGPSQLETDLPNVFIYTIAAEQGAYVLGDLAGNLTTTGIIGIIGPVPVPEPQRFVEGFRLGAERHGVLVLSDYVGSFNDVEAATALAQSHLAAGADILTGTSQLTIGPINLAQNEGLLWFANQANQTSLAPDHVVASQVYHLEVALREILAEIDANATTGGTFPLTLGNGGMLLEFNPNYPLTEEQRRRADNLLFDVTAGSVTIDINLEQ